MILIGPDEVQCPFSKEKTGKFPSVSISASKYQYDSPKPAFPHP